MTLVRTTAHRFENELGREIRVSVEQHDDERFVIAVEGPDSIATNELTRREADELLMILTVALGTARETA